MASTSPNRKTKKPKGAPARSSEGGRAGKRGRPSQYSQALALRILGLAKNGLTDVQIAHKIGIPAKTLRNWKGQHADFRDALKAAKDIADELVEASLFRRAVGFTHKAVKFFQDDGQILSQAYTEVYPPDTTACIFWLKNRQPDRWRDTKQHELTGKDGKPIESRQVSEADVKRAAVKAVKDAGEPSEDF